MHVNLFITVNDNKNHSFVKGTRLFLTDIVNFINFDHFKDKKIPSY